MSENTKKIIEAITPILEKADVLRSDLFGSYARGEENKDSDIDILVEFKGRKSLFDLVDLQTELKDKLNRKVDVLTYRSIHPLLRDIIMKEHQVIYEKRQ